MRYVQEYKYQKNNLKKKKKKTTTKTTTQLTNKKTPNVKNNFLELSLKKKLTI